MKRSLGTTLSFHRQLSHKSFQTPMWLEYAPALQKQMAWADCVLSSILKMLSVCHRVPGDHTELPQAAEPQVLPDTEVAGVCAGLLRSAGGAGGPHRVGLLPQIPPPAHGHPPGPPLPLRGILVVPHGMAAQQWGKSPIAIVVWMPWRACLISQV